MFRPADVFFDLQPQGTFSDHLSELDDFLQKSMFLKIEQKNLLRATKNLKIFSAWSLGSQVYPTILVWCGYAHFGIYGGLYVKNGRFLSFFNSAGVLVQPWIRILMSKFEVFLECWKYYNTPFCTWNYVYFGWTNIFCCINHEDSKFLEFSMFFFKISAGFTSQFCSFFRYVKICPNFCVPHVRKSKFLLETIFWCMKCQNVAWCMFVSTC